MSEKVGLKPCPFCGKEPALNNSPVCIDIECCVSMSLQKSDYLTLAERNTWSKVAHNYSVDCEEKVLSLAIGNWNTRAVESCNNYERVKAQNERLKRLAESIYAIRNLWLPLNTPEQHEGENSALFLMEEKLIQALKEKE
jgi:hypothetical protein